VNSVSQKLSPSLLSPVSPIWLRNFTPRLLATLTKSSTLPTPPRLESITAPEFYTETHSATVKRGRGATVTRSRWLWCAAAALPSGTKPTLAVDSFPTNYFFPDSSSWFVSNRRLHVDSRLWGIVAFSLHCTASITIYKSVNFLCYLWTKSGVVQAIKSFECETIKSFKVLFQTASIYIYIHSSRPLFLPIVPGTSSRTHLGHDQC
jgi:hypothetical protein